MFMRAMTLGVTAAAVLAAPTVFADPNHYPPGQYKKGRYERVYPTAEYDYARVISADPIVRRVRVEVPRRECWNETRYEEPRASSGVAGSTILGGIIGGVIGHQIGKGDDRRLATVAGAVVGSAVGHNAATRRAEAGPVDGREYTVERCETRYVESFEERVEGYDVEYEYGNRRYHTRLPYDPGDRMRIRVDVTPTYRR